MRCGRLPASRPPESRRLRPFQHPFRRPPDHRLTPPGIAATAATARVWLMSVFTRLTPPGIAATAAATGTTNWNSHYPPHAPRNRGDCGRSHFLRFRANKAASRPPESRRLRLAAAGDGGAFISRLTPPGIAATAALSRALFPRSRRAASRPPESRRLRLASPRFDVSGGSPASRPPESRRLRRS